MPPLQSGVCKMPQQQSSPATPSPHRFLAKAQQRAEMSKSDDASKPKARIHPLRASGPGLERRAPKFVTKAAVAPVSATQMPQFATAPRFSFARSPATKRPRLEDEGAQFATPRRFISEALTPLHIEADDEDVPIDREENEASLNKSSKLPHPPPYLDAPLPAPQIKDASPPSPLPRRPAFLKLASPTNPEPIEPLPEAFSPHRRGQKFMSGGMASAVRQWILDASQLSTHARRSLRGEEIWRVRIVESTDKPRRHMTLVKGVTEEQKEVKLMLPCAGKKKGLSETIVEGSVIAIKRPTWDVVLDQMGWVVAIDWNIENPVMG
ncbi:uncharacterized protein PV09_06078 [Verruconis gallopava]|uniref:Uncharacterized protein n=1 Tax=Verruconis gallopava TaxID=253628 RepID=A0A0D2A7B7_9PEZI|nr:uncharacterized protein PV09_06078 [Verruconis gallopava]KIW02638.1 hypothetical protein PV09_06078 [Verruconis gallopava]